ncbi:MAG: transporter [Eubacterium sp.]|nr:transporter [Eubacterium sp.]
MNQEKEPLVKFRIILQHVVRWIEMCLSAFIAFAVIVMFVRVVLARTGSIFSGDVTVTHILTYGMNLAVGVEFARMLYHHSLNAVIEVVIFATARQMVVEHLDPYATLLNVAALAGLFFIQKFLLKPKTVAVKADESEPAVEFKKLKCDEEEVVEAEKKSE